MTLSESIAVIIPAHNEEGVIKRCLSSLLASAKPGEFEVWVMCNGCTDRTASTAAEVSDMVKVVEISAASKPHAMNTGDSLAKGFPRFYLDADVVVSTELIRRMAKVLRDSKILGVTPFFDVELAGCSWPVRAFYKIYKLLPSVAKGAGGSGIYGASREGRHRFKDFPNVIADDTFFRLHFAGDEWGTFPDWRSKIFPPKDVNTLVRIKTRTYRGEHMLKRSFPDQWKANHPGANHIPLLKLFLRPTLWPSLAAYIYVRILTRLRTLTPQRKPFWERDESSRSSPVKNESKL